METKRIFIGGLFAGIGEADLKERIGRFGDVSNIELKTRKSADGEPVKTFAHLNLESTPDNFKKCVATYNGSKWKGSTLSIQVAKENFLDRLQKERVTLDEKKMEVAAAPVTPKDIRVPGSKPGDPVPGEENWVVGKFGRALPVVHMRRKDGKKIMKVDPSKYTHSLKVLKDVEAEPANVNELTWEMDEKISEIEKKKMGLFPAMKKKKKYVASSVDADVLREVKDAERSRLEEFEVVSHGRMKARDVGDDLDSDDTDEILAMKRPRHDMGDQNSRGGLQMSDSPMETDDSDSGVDASRARNGPKYFEKVLHVSEETDEIILMPGSSGNQPSRENGHVGANSDSDDSTDIDDILNRIQVKKKATPKGKRVKASAPKSLESSDEEEDSVVKAKKPKLGTSVDSGHVTPSSSCALNDSKNKGAIKKTKKSSKKEKVRTLPEKSVVICGSDEDDLEEAEAFHEPKQGNLSWTKPVKKMKISRRDIVSFDDAGGVVDKPDEADAIDSAGSADTDELFSNMRKKTNTFAKLQGTPKISLPQKGTPVTKTFGLNVSVVDEFASGLDDVAEPRSSSKQKSDFESDESDSDSDSGTEIVVRDAGKKSLSSKETTGIATNLNVSSGKITTTPGASSMVKNAGKIAPISSDSDDEFVSCDSGSESDSDSSLSDAKKTARRSISKATPALLKSDSDNSKSDDEESSPSDSSSDSENIQPSVSRDENVKTKPSAELESDSSEIESESESDDSDTSDSDDQETAQKEVVKSKSIKKSTSASPAPVSSKFDTKKVKQNVSSDSDSSSGSESDSDSSLSDAKKTARRSISKATPALLKSDSDNSKSDDEESSPSDSSSDSENIQPSVSRDENVKTKPSAELESDSSEIESESESDDSDTSDSDDQETAQKEVVKSKLIKKSTSASPAPVSSKFDTKKVKQNVSSDSDSSSDSSEAESDASSEQISGKEIVKSAALKAGSESEKSSESEMEMDNLKSEPKGKKTSTVLKTVDLGSTGSGTSQQADSKETVVQSKKEKKKNTKKATKNMSKVEKHKSDDLKRLDSFKQRRKENQEKKVAIREALAAVDSRKTKAGKGKKIVFSESDSSEESSDDAAKLEKAPGLFESEEDEEAMEGVDEMFRIRPQFEGKAGKKLLRLQRRYGDDERFKMDEKFLDSESDDEGVEKMVPQPSDAAEEKSERDRQIDVLKDMFGSRAVDKKVAKKPTFQNTSSVHFDPTLADHTRFEVAVEPKKTDKKKKRKKGEDEVEKSNEPELPEVSKERFFEVATDLKDIFQGKAETSTFSFLTQDPEDGKESVEKLASPEPEACQPSSLLPWQVETFNYDTSSGEEEEDDRMETKQTEAEPQTPRVDTKLFFFSLDDSRIKEGVDSFYRTEEVNVMRQEWWEKRPALIDSYRMTRKRALRRHVGDPNISKYSYRTYFKNQKKS